MSRPRKTSWVVSAITTPLVERCTNLRRACSILARAFRSSASKSKSKKAQNVYVNLPAGDLARANKEAFETAIKKFGHMNVSLLMKTERSAEIWAAKESLTKKKDFKPIPRYQRPPNMAATSLSSGTNETSLQGHVSRQR